MKSERVKFPFSFDSPAKIAWYLKLVRLCSYFHVCMSCLKKSITNMKCLFHLQQITHSIIHMNVKNVNVSLFHIIAGDINIAWDLKHLSSLNSRSRCLTKVIAILKCLFCPQLFSAIRPYQIWINVKSVYFLFPYCSQ